MNAFRCIELKFVERMRRAFEFSVDSFQITLDPLIDQPNEHRPTVRAESMYGDFMGVRLGKLFKIGAWLQALYHLTTRLIDTRNPEEIRGGGLLKYCHLASPPPKIVGTWKRCAIGLINLYKMFQFPFAVHVLSFLH